MDEKKTLYDIVLEFWNLLKYLVEHQEMTDEDWEGFIKVQGAFTKKYQKNKFRYYSLVRMMNLCATHYAEQRRDELKNANK